MTPSHKACLLAGALVGCPLLATRPCPAQTQPAAQQPAHYGRAALEMLGFLGIGATWYWLDIERNLADWDRLSVRQRFTLQAIRLDNNDFAVNHVWHPVAGAAYYSFSRANGLSPGMSTLYTLGTSIAWEYGLEFQERTSYNDFLVTPGAGIAIGEAAHALGTYLHSGCVGGVGTALGALFGPAVAIHQAIDGPRAPCTGERDNLGLDARTRHAITLSAGVTKLWGSGRSAVGHQLSLASELITLANYGTDSAWQGSFADAPWTLLKLDAMGGKEATGNEFEAHTVFAGYHTQRGQPLWGIASTAGIGLGYHYLVRSYPGYRDQLSQMLLPGAYHRSVLRWGNVLLTMNARLSPDFSASNSLNLGQARTALTGQRGKSVLAKQGYYYGFGWSSSVLWQLTGPGWHVAVGADYNEVHSIEGRDREQEQLQVDEQSFDARHRLHAMGRFHLGRLRGAHPYVQIAWQRMTRHSYLVGLRARREATTAGVQVGLEL